MTETPLAVGDRIQLHLDSLAAGGEAVGRHEGRAVFVMWGCPGDDALVEVTEVAPRFARAKLVELIAPSPDRVRPPCASYQDCGGCQLEYIAYPAQLRHKTAMVRDAVARIGRLPNVPIAETVGMEEPWHYRNRVEYHAGLDESGRVFLGFLRYHTHDVIPANGCHVQHPLSERVQQLVSDLVNRFAPRVEERGRLYRVEVFVSFALQQALVTLICDGRPAFVPLVAQALMEEGEGIAGVLAARSRGRTTAHRSPSEVIQGKSRLTERLGEYEYHVSADSFFQVNPVQATRLLALVQEWAAVGRQESIIDAYCGVGTFLLPLASQGGPALGIESDESSLNDARLNATTWHLREVHLQRGKVEKVLPEMVHEGGRCDVLVLDPPRRGCGPLVSVAATRLRPHRLLLISCDPATLARDLKTLSEHGYAPTRLQPIDMFPHTWHVETVALCEPRG